MVLGFARFLRPYALVCWPLLVGCTSEVGGGYAEERTPANDSSSTGSGSGGSSAGGGATTSSGAGGAAEGVDPGTLEDGVPFSTRVARLTHLQYDNTVSDLLYLEVQPSLEFQPDPIFGGYDNSAEDLVVADRLGRDYRRAAEELAALLVADGDAYQRVMPCDSSETSCADQFVSEFGARAYRRPLSEAEKSLYIALFMRGPELVGSGDDTRDGVQLVVEAMLQSPKFLYRAELAQDEQADGYLELDGYELAQRLSYMLWNTMPDQELFDAAAENTLSTQEGLLAQAERLLDDPRAEGPVADFHFQWLELSHYADLTRSAQEYPDFSPDLPLQQETLEFIRHIAFDLEQGYESLLTAPFTFVDAGLARLYGLDGDFGEELEKVELDAGERGGLLTQIGFLASHAYPNETSPIHRGVFINRQILCADIPDPPANIDTSEGAVENPRTTREAVEQQTSGPACANCHDLINPPGFAFENFDAVGQVRDTDRGNPIDTSGTLLLDGEMVSFDSSRELTQQIAGSEAGRSCFARNLLRYAFARDETTSDRATLAALTDNMSSDGYGVKQALLELTRAKAFTLRAPNRD